MNDPLSLIYEACVIKKQDPLQAIYDRIKIINGQKIIEGDANLSNLQLTKLPDLHDVHITGSFYCDHNKLVNLEGAPVSVGGAFFCFYNQLTSLKGAPAYVERKFSCDDNRLTSLEGAPGSVGRDFDCMNNQLTSLKGAPKSVGWSFYCINNRLTSLEDGPESIGERFYCENNPLPEGTPEVMNAQQYQEYRKKFNLQKEFGNDIGQTIYDL